jgi:hypothetical protein
MPGRLVGCLMQVGVGASGALFGMLEAAVEDWLRLTP